VGTIKKDATNPFFKSKYATLENIIAHITDPLATNKLTFSQFPDGAGLTTILMHESGEWMKATMPLHMGTKPQEQGSALTYARRYALSAVLGLAVDEDDDGNEASKPTAKPVAAPKPVAKPVSADEARRIEARKDRIMNLAEMLGGPQGVDLSEMSAEARKAYSVDLMAFITKQGITIPFKPENFEKIGEELAILVEKNVDPTK
jgi:hypothetical protein